jgi:hypothetical protein
MQLDSPLLNFLLEAWVAAPTGAPSCPQLCKRL